MEDLTKTSLEKALKEKRYWILEGKIPRNVTMDEYITWDKNPPEGKKSPRMLFNDVI